MENIIDFCRNSPNLTKEENAACARICIANDNGVELNENDIAIIEAAMKK